MPLSTRIVDIASGRPAAGVRVKLEHREGDTWRSLSKGVSQTDGGVVLEAFPTGGVERVLCRLTYATNAYFAELGQVTSYAEIVVEFIVVDNLRKLDLAVLISPHAYTVCHTLLS